MTENLTVDQARKVLEEAIDQADRAYRKAEARARKARYDAIDQAEQVYHAAEAQAEREGA